jgi:hypothetical protein
MASTENNMLAAPQMSKKRWCRHKNAVGRNRQANAHLQAAQQAKEGSLAPKPGGKMSEARKRFWEEARKRAE